MRLLHAMLLTAAMLPAQTLEGIVVNSGTGLGIPDVRVELRLVFIPGAGIDAYPESLPPETTTDASGRFRFSIGQAATLTVVCEKEGFEKVTQSAVKVTTAWDSAPVRIEMVPHNSIGGRILDRDRHPVPRADVTLTGAYRDLTAITESDGTFGFDRLPPGDYYLTARAPADWPRPDAVEGVELRWTTTFYPGVISRGFARPLVLDGGGDLTHLELRLLAVPLRHVRGVVLSPDGHPMPKSEIKVADVGAKTLSPATFHAGEDGAFDLPLSDGSWSLSAAARDGSSEMEAARTIDVSRSDVEKVQLRMMRPFGVEGVVRYDPPMAPESVKASPRQVPPQPALVSISSPGRKSSYVRVGPDDRFVLEAFPGTHRLSAESGMRAVANGNSIPYVSSSYYLTSLRVDGREAIGKDVNLVPGTTIEILFEAHGGTVRGTVPDTGLMELILQPEEPWLREYTSIMVFKDGRFEIPYVRPGAYLVAVQRADGLANFMSSEPVTLTDATNITVRPGETTTVDLRPSK